MFTCVSVRRGGGTHARTGDNQARGLLNCVIWEKTRSRSTQSAAPSLQTALSLSLSSCHYPSFEHEGPRGGVDERRAAARQGRGGAARPQLHRQVQARQGRPVRGGRGLQRCREEEGDGERQGTPASKCVRVCVTLIM